MSWDILALGFLIVLAFGVAIVMARKTKPTPASAGDVDIEELATKIARAVAKEMAAELLKSMPRGGAINSGTQVNDPEFSDIQIDERIIPIAVKQEVIEANVSNMAKEEIQVDKDLDKSKSKLAGLLKKRNQ